jgi:hypothetical protein
MSSHLAAGCHFNQGAIDQTDAWDAEGNDLVEDRDCQCNYDLKGEKWSVWVSQWHGGATPKAGFGWQGWFGGGRAPSFAMDFAACWVNNPRDMIDLQNAMWFDSMEWSNQLEPTSQWDSGDAPSMRPCAAATVHRELARPRPHRPQVAVPSRGRYWGWNEVPVAGSVMDDPANWDAIVVKLPAAVCGGQDKDSVQCLSDGAQQQLERDLDVYVHWGMLVPGADHLHERPGSSVLFLNDEAVDAGRKFQRRFACEPWTSPSKKYVVAAAGDGNCYIAHAGPDAEAAASA